MHAFFARDYNERYRIIKFFQRWKEFNQTDPEKIVQMIHRDLQKEEFDLQLLQKLFEELDLDFLRAHKQIYFDLQLPYDKEKYKLFKSVLPADKFEPVTERIPHEDRAPALVKIPEREKPFVKRFNRISNNLHQANYARLKVLQMCHRFKQDNL